VLTQAVKSYLTVRRACGFELRGIGRYLRSFAAYSDARGEFYVRSETAIEWAGLARSVSERARRLGDVIRFARYVRSEDQRHEVPPAAFGSENRQRRPVPYIFSRHDVERLVQAAIHPRFRGLRRDTYSTFFALLACTGLRVSEAIKLRYDDITPDGLVIRCTKFRKSRLVPLHETARVQLERYLARRRRYCPFDDHVFVSMTGKQLHIDCVECAFRIAARKIGLPCAPQRPRATVHSLRHTFAVRALERCPDGRDRITQHMLALSTYLGHTSVASTYWYLTATPELMRDIAERTETFVKREQP
jgi:integrase/recombinase XerD